jgi:hypothetical protein
MGWFNNTLIGSDRRFDANFTAGGITAVGIHNVLFGGCNNGSRLEAYDSSDNLLGSILSDGDCDTLDLRANNRHSDFVHLRIRNQSARMGAGRHVLWPGNRWFRSDWLEALASHCGGRLAAATKGFGPSIRDEGAGVILCGLNRLCLVLSLNDQALLTSIEVHTYFALVLLQIQRLIEDKRQRCGEEYDADYGGFRKWAALRGHYTIQTHPAATGLLTATV